MLLPVDRAPRRPGASLHLCQATGSVNILGQTLQLPGVQHMRRLPGVRADREALYVLFAGAGGAYAESDAPDPGSYPVNTAGAAGSGFFMRSVWCPQGTRQRTAEAGRPGDAGERGGWPDKSPCHEGEDNFND